VKFARRGKVPGSLSIGCEGTIMIKLAAIDISPGCAIDDQVGSFTLNYSVYQDLIRDVETFANVRQHVVSDGGAVIAHCSPYHSRGPGNQHSQITATSVPYCFL
jgi:hypothetical protein